MQKHTKHPIRIKRKFGASITSLYLCHKIFCNQGYLLLLFKGLIDKKKK